MFNLFTLEATTATATGSTGSPYTMIIMMAVLFGAMYFLMIRPQKKQQKKDQEMRESTQVGDEVTTIGGIIGRVVRIKDETCVIETSKDGTKIRILKTAIKSVDVKAEDA